MFMPQRSDFFRVDRQDVGDRPSDRQSEKIERAIFERSIRIRNIDMASRRIVEDYPDLAGWYCLSVKNRREFAVEKWLTEAGVIASVPTRRGYEMRKRGRIIAAPILPVVPNYVLVMCVPSPQAFVGLRGADFVTGMVGRGEIPYRVPARIAEQFKALAENGVYDERPVECRYKKGEKVRVTDGPFASFPGIVIDMTMAASHGRINVEVHIFGRSAPVELDIDQIEKLS